MQINSGFRAVFKKKKSFLRTTLFYWNTAKFRFPPAGPIHTLLSPCSRQQIFMKPNYCPGSKSSNGFLSLYHMNQNTSLVLWELGWSGSSSTCQPWALFFPGTGLKTRSLLCSSTASSDLFSHHTPPPSAQPSPGPSLSWTLHPIG